MNIATITTQEKLKMFDKMMKSIKSARPENDDRLYDSCKTCGFILYEFLTEKEKITFEGE